MTSQLFNGVLPVYKPRGMISKDVSRFLVRRLGRVKLGHLGTLDPMAEGLLPILMGHATRLQDRLLEIPKKYEFEVSFGKETDTLDADGVVVKEATFDHLDEALILAHMVHFRGPIVQLPPAYSAAKYKGKPLYEYARGQKLDDVPIKSLERKVNVLSFELLSFAEGKAYFAVECSKGTYVRVLAKDLSEKLGTCGTVTKIVRSSCGGIERSQSMSLEHIEENIENFGDLLIPIHGLPLALPNWQSIEPVWTRRLLMGQKLLIKNDHFQRCIKGNLESISSCEGNFFLMNEDGVAFGIGNAQKNKDGCIQMSMTRGLQ